MVFALSYIRLINSMHTFWSLKFFLQIGRDQLKTEAMRAHDKLTIGNAEH